MSIPPGSLITEIDFKDPACFTNGGTAVTDLSGSANNFTFNNTSYTYNSVYGSIDCPIGTQFSPNNVTFLGTGVVPFTMNFWHYATATSESIFYNGCFPGAGYFGPQCYWNGSNLIYRVNTISGPVDTGIYSINTWHMFTVEYDGTTLKIYIDGVYAAGGNRNLDQTGARTGIAFSNILDNTGVNGLALINVYDVAIGAGEIANLYSEQLPRFNVVAAYDLNSLTSYSGTGNTVYDLTGNGKNLTLSNTTYYDGVNYNSLVFTESPVSYARYNGSLGVPTGPPVFTFFMWIKTTSYRVATNTDIFFSYGTVNNPAIGGIPLIASRLGGVSEAYTEFGYGLAGIDSNTATVLNEWTNYCITSDGTTYKLYVDGALVGSVALSGANIDSSPQLNIGAFFDPGGSYGCNLEFNYLDVYNTALSAGEITDLYDNTVTRFAPFYQGSVGGRQFAQGFNG